LYWVLLLLQRKRLAEFYPFAFVLAAIVFLYPAIRNQCSGTAGFGDIPALGSGNKKTGVNQPVMTEMPADSEPRGDDHQEK